MSHIIKIILFVFIALATFILMNFIYVNTTYESDINEHCNFIDLSRNVAKDSSEMIYIGESSNTSSIEQDEDKRSISQMIASYYPNLRFGHLTKEASHAGIFYELLRNIPKNSRVKTVIVTMNLRSFNANWIHSNLETALQKNIVLIKDRPALYNRFCLAFKAYDAKTDKQRDHDMQYAWKHDHIDFSNADNHHSIKEWDNFIAKSGIKNPDGTVNEAATELACHYIKTYAFTIDTLKNPRIKDFDHIVELAKERGWKLVFNILAENIEKANALIGSELIQLIRKNRDILFHRYNKGDILLIDNLELVKDRDFTDKKWTTEHYNENGRHAIAQNVAKALETIYKKDFKDQTLMDSISADYFNDCEGKISHNSLSNERSYSGSMSSKTGGGNEFSITYSMPIHKLADSLKSIDINFQLFRENTNSEAKLVIEITGKNIEYNWNGADIDKLAHKVNEWETIHYSFPLNYSLYQGDLLKIYLWNKSKTIIYLDDLNIKFLK